jgi:hypothetical protein
MKDHKICKGGLIFEKKLVAYLPYINVTMTYEKCHITFLEDIFTAPSYFNFRFRLLALDQTQKANVRFESVSSCVCAVDSVSQQQTRMSVNRMSTHWSDFPSHYNIYSFPDISTVSD